MAHADPADVLQPRHYAMEKSERERERFYNCRRVANVVYKGSEKHFRFDTKGKRRKRKEVFYYEYVN